MTDYPSYVTPDRQEAWDKLTDAHKDAIDKVENPARWVTLPVATGNVDALVSMDPTQLPPGYDVIARIERGELDRFLGRIHAAVTKRLAEDG